MLPGSRRLPAARSRRRERGFHSSAATADFLRASGAAIACIVQGRRLFDPTNDWNGRPAAGDHVFVVTHEPPSDWEYAGDIGGQALRLGPVDRVMLNQVPAVHGSGCRSFGAEGLAAPLLLQDPQVVEGSRVTRLVYDVRR